MPLHLHGSSSGLTQSLVINIKKRVVILNQLSMKNVVIFFRTILDLKFKQIFYRIYYDAFQRSISPKKIKNHKRNTKWNRIESITSFLAYAHWKKGDIEQNCFVFLNIKQGFKNHIDWNVPKMDRLWRYNLNYFQYLLLEEKLEQSFSINLIKSWIVSNPVGTCDSWDPFPTSLRIVNWLKFLSASKIDQKNLTLIAQSLIEQCLWLEKNLEFHLLGNHLFKNGKALMFMGLAFSGPDADRWLAKGEKIIFKELDEQILSDGGHFERSPMYHCMITEDCLDLLNVLLFKNRPKLEYLSEKLMTKSKKMVWYLSWMVFSDGQISLFNDSAMGIEAEPFDLFQYYEKVTKDKMALAKAMICSFPQTGYYILNPRQDCKMIIDCGEIGPSYQPGHSHCDTLSFEFSVKGHRVIVDSGCSEYKQGSIRSYNRGNQGHNTITIDQKNQSDVWAAHRCGAKAMPIKAALDLFTDSTIVFKGGHDGYKDRSGNPVHYREVKYKDSIWFIIDIIKGFGLHSIQSRLHINPFLDLKVKNNEAKISVNNKTLLKILLLGQGSIEVKQGWYCPEFGKKYDCNVLEYNLSQVHLPFACGWKFITF